MSSSYTILHALIGGVLIGLASWIALMATGKVPGISGLFSRLLRPRTDGAAWRAIFFVGLLLGAGLAFAAIAAAGVYHPVRSGAAMVIAGILVGFGTRLGGGCTSGHGVCGIGLGSRPALVATMLFMLSGMATVWALNHGGLDRFLP